MMWDSVNFDAIKTRQEKDSIVAFAVAKLNSTKLLADSVVMMGRQYIFVLNDKNKILRTILNTNLPRAFEVHEYRETFQPKLLGYFPIEMDNAR